MAPHAGLLGNLSNKVNIIEDYEQQTIRFNIAGYSKICRGVHVQANHALLYSLSEAVSIDGQKPKLRKPILVVSQKPSQQVINYPFGLKESSTPLASVILDPEPSNKYDPYALVVCVTIPVNLKEWINGKNDSVYSLVLGYVPKAISMILNKNLHRINSPGWIYSIRRSQLFSSMVEFKYCPDQTTGDSLFDRLMNINE